MDKIINSLKIHNSNIKHKKIMIIIGSLIILLSQYVNYYYYVLDKNKLYNSLRGQTYVIAILTLFFMINGYFLGKSEEKDKCEEVLSCITNGEIFNLTGKLLLGVIYSLIITSVLDILIIIIYMKMGNFLLFKEVISFIFQYHFIPILVGYLIGYIVGNNIKGNKGYLLIILLWFSLTPLNNELFRVLSNMFHTINVNYLKWLLTQGFINSEMEIYNSIIGINVSITIVVKNIVILLISLVVVYRKYINKKIIIPSISIVIIFICGYMYINSKSIEVDIFQNRTQYDFIKFERENQNPNINYMIESVNMKINFDNKTKFESKLEINNIKDENITFYLHPFFTIESISDELGQTVKFTRDNDEVNIVLNSTETKSLDIKYYGYSKYGMYMNMEQVYLPNFINYIPTNRTGFTDDNDIEYFISTNLSNISYSNLEFKDGQLNGKSNDGVILLATDQLKEIKIDSYNIYYSPSLYSEEDIKLNLEKIVSGYKFSNKLFSDLFNNEEYDIKNIAIVNIPLLPSLITVSNESLLVQDYNSIINDGAFLDYIIRGELKGNYQNNATNNILINNIYINLIKEYSNKRYNTNFMINSIPNEDINYDEVKRIENLINKMNIEDLKEFINDYYNLINKGVNVTNISELVDLYEKRYGIE